MYTVEDGLPSNEFSLSALVNVPDNRCIAGSSNGIVSFFIQQRKDSVYPPRPQLTNIYINDMVYLPTQTPDEIKKISLSYRENTFAFDFSFRAHTISPIFSVISSEYPVIFSNSVLMDSSPVFLLRSAWLRNFILDKPAPKSSCMSEAIRVRSRSMACRFSNSSFCFRILDLKYHLANNHPINNINARPAVLKRVVCQKALATCISSVLIKGPGLPLAFVARKLKT